MAHDKVILALSVFNCSKKYIGKVTLTADKGKATENQIVFKR
jgi:hypothetical protein